MRTMIYRIFPSHLYHCLQSPKMVELPDWSSSFSVFQKSARNSWHLFHCLKSWHLIRGHNLTHILPWICFHIGKPSFFRSLASDPNLRKSPEIRRFLALDFISLTSRLPSRQLFQFPREVLSLPRHQQAQGSWKQSSLSSYRLPSFPGTSQFAR